MIQLKYFLSKSSYNKENSVKPSRELYLCHLLIYLWKIKKKSGNQRTSKVEIPLGKGRDSAGNPQYNQKQLLKLPFKWDFLIKQAFKADWTS